MTYIQNILKFKPVIISTLFFVLCIILWQVVVTKEYINSFVLASPQRIMISLIDDASLIFPSAAITFLITIAGILLSIISAIVVGILMTYIPLLKHVCYPIILVFQIVPVIIFAPLLLVVFGYGVSTQLFIITSMCFFPMLVSLLRGLESVSVQYIVLLQSMGASMYQVFRWLLFPKALFFMCSGLRLSIAYAVTAAIISEWVGASRGLGVIMVTSQKSFLIERVFAVNVVVVVLSIILYVGAILLEHKIMPWKNYLKKM